MARKAKTIIGWEEWCSIPFLGLPAIKAKVDTGAKTSCLHAFGIEPFQRDGEKFVRFKIHPIQGNQRFKLTCEAPLVDRRGITSSNGDREKRFVIKVPLEFENGHKINAELTLTSRHKMAFRMLLGREAITKAKFTVDPGKSFQLGKVKNCYELYGQPAPKPKIKKEKP